MLRFLGLLLAIWLVVTVAGAVIKGLLAAVIGALFFAVTAVLGWNKRRHEVGGGPAPSGSRPDASSAVRPR